MGQHTGLQRRGARYYLRVRVPEPLRPLVGKREVTKALGTADYRTAVERLHQARVEVDALFKAARRQLARAKAEAAPEPSQQVVVEAVRGWLAKAERAALACPLPPDQAQDILDSTRLDAAAFGSADAVEDPSIQGLAREIVEALGYRLRDGSPAFWLAASLTARAGVEHARREEARIAGDPGATFDQLFAGMTAASAPAPARAVTFGELVERYRTDPGRQIAPKTRIVEKTAHTLLLEVIGASTPLPAVDREACRRVQALVQRLPANWNKMKPRRTAEKAAEHAAGHGLPAIAAKTANSYLAALAALFRFAEREGLTDRNPARGLLIAGDAGSLNRRPFRPDELQTIAAALARVDRSSGAEFWLPLLGLFTGARLGELCQLDVADVAKRDGATVLLIREDPATGRRVKTKNAVRMVPVHPELRRLGFLDHVAAARQRGETRLFPELRPAASGYVSDIASKRFSRWLRGLGITDRAVSFHSFRHGFRDALREAGVPVEMARALGGWARGENASEGYGSGFRPPTLASEVAKVAYPGLDLRALYPSTSSVELRGPAMA